MTSDARKAKASAIAQQLRRTKLWNGNAKQPSTRCLTAPLRGNTNTARPSMAISTRYRAAGVGGRARVGSSTALAQRCPYMPQPCTKLKHGQKEWPQREMVWGPMYNREMFVILWRKQFYGILKGNILKYLWRNKYKHYRDN